MKTYDEVLAEVEVLKSKIEELETINKLLTEKLNLENQKKYGPSSEKTEDDLQLNLFNEAEATREAISPEPVLEEITYKRKKQKGHREKLLANLTTEIIEYTLPESEQECPKCHESLHVMSKEVRKELEIIPAQVKVVEHVSYVYTCRNCEKNEELVPVITAPSPKALIFKSLVSPSLISHIMCQKFLNAMPLYRQEQDFKRFDIHLSRQTMANWMIAGAKLLAPVWNLLKNELVSREVLHADETTLEVLNEPGRPAQANSYMWLYKTAKPDSPVVIYDYKQGRSGEFPKTFLKAFKGFLMVDGYTGYRRLEPEIKLSCCWAHVQRKFDEAWKALPEKKAESAAAIGLVYCNKLFEIERELADKSIEDRKNTRQERSKAVCEEFFAWAETESYKTLPKSLIGKALDYALKLKKYLLVFLEGGRLELSNNSAERSIKPFVIGRKNWLFCNTPAGADSSAIIYSIIETAKENGLKPYEYLKFLFTQIQISNSGNEEKPLNDFLPWSEYVPEDCKMKGL